MGSFVPLPSAVRAVLYAPYLAVFYPFLFLRRTKAALRPDLGGAWRTWVGDHLLLGGFLAPHDIPVIAREGVGAVVNVTRELIEPRGAIAAAGIDYLQIPCWDGRVPSIEEAAGGVRFIAGHVAAGRKVYVHCASGVGRSVSLLLCYLAAHEGADVEEALAGIRKTRPRVNLSRVQRAFVDEFLAAHRAGSVAISSPTARVRAPAAPTAEPSGPTPNGREPQPSAASQKYRQVFLARGASTTAAHRKSRSGRPRGRAVTVASVVAAPCGGTPVAPPIHPGPRQFA
ncbi:MAG: dual specificity protein phosphatase family protein [Minicystis sp.]